ncbi:hypothetical protein QBC40DRAFT_35623 [Triangularia verruculosa]|uniref:Uncharacterized protein n=1 Tax=Triangularia verruculosa TaxID=2587418 RepID=A0AAN7B1Y9_9PEZI|nr:hypothetical protein QBC40DRAFT_35623 [Triangularia verruculosa]
MEARRMRYAKVIEETASLVVGKARHKRRCIECRFQQKLYRNFLRGHLNAPIVTCHDTPGIHIIFNRLFHGLLPRLRGETDLHPTHWCFANFANQQDRHPTRDQILRIRCPACEKWQNSRAFGMTPVDAEGTCSSAEYFSPVLKGSMIRMEQSSPLCHYCRATTHGKEATATRLADVALEMLRKDIFSALQKVWNNWEY